MLKIVDVLPAAAGKLVVDDYIPFSFRLSQPLMADPYLWQTGNLKTSLLEMTIDRDTHAIRGVTLTCFAGRVEVGAPQGYMDTNFFEGIPVVDTSPFSHEKHENPLDFRLDRLAEPNDIRVFQAGNNFFLVFGGENVPSRCIETSRIGFFEWATRICGIGFFDLSPSEISSVVSQLRG